MLAIMRKPESLTVSFTWRVCDAENVVTLCDVRCHQRRPTAPKMDVMKTATTLTVMTATIVVVR